MAKFSFTFQGMKVFVLLASMLLLTQGCFSPTGSPLHRAAKSGDQTAVERLLASGARVDRRDALGCTPLYVAAANGQAEIVRQLLAKGAKPEKGALLKDGDTPLHAAAENGHDEIVKILIEAGAKVDCPNQAKQTPLILASQERHPSTVALLLDQGANPKAADRYGWTALHGSWRISPPDENYRLVMKMLIERGASVNHKTLVPYGITPLIAASTMGDVETVKLLLKAGARIDDRDQDGNTAYLMARRQQNAEVSQILADHGARQVPAR